VWKGTPVSVPLLSTANYTERKLTQAYKEASQLGEPLIVLLKIEMPRRTYASVQGGVTILGTPDSISESGKIQKRSLHKN
jgi:hypothetical protein